MRVVIRDNPEAASQYVAEHIIHRINAFKPAPFKPFFVLGLPTGDSPKRVYSLLVKHYKAGHVSFKNVVTFNMVSLPSLRNKDEYVGIPEDHPQSYRSFMYEYFFSHVDIAPEHINLLNGNSLDIHAECLEYEEKIKRVGGVDLFLGGIGPNGHIAFNEPGSSLASRTRVKTLAHETLLANSRSFGSDVHRVPRLALTIGVQTVMEAREVVVIATGANKALALQKCIEGGVSHMRPLSSLQMHPYAMLVLDEEATLDLQVSTVKYFKSTESVMNETG
ncbi:Glucosamine-6-phosphate isomerase (Glucosamine-6-phosphate deaminase) (GNPDA) (GlcN6P deaminase) [Elasticomyces elasticus]|uniref:Glucosamine-6-phosphate isomerase n=1 Tax=Exophiala sideris TaxID=1016849 RepID=A0ABR0J6C1_9EURO|nr:Glucosamine-6-phosphate isomerase (Glucosamine-6-phosphate deaminase) (GNPDA) (GlcN6P deaminase) [Elasticomyces elasticus]KAK5028848.1 Glucosamine-6-phosphate isomerase (Glucosamine-6-phosphate deaminase) (GNPDA) (GlcN6P deaminase) [Exophiala sideris]KAK5035717.1 Glucosamine-6-phosphate isomerase (Glucosamine-6-phosphate deaminase) (GNPDA) (GlcN6P deaminase) [Exophiala sideris]KAK5057352.1 Glucosamine-6-phosphate isomerase (Glucosamine-6-phosphate deaminase) (GNPDA) (GlcN6P deaminase) [Exophi